MHIDLQIPVTNNIIINNIKEENIQLIDVNREVENIEEVKKEEEINEDEFIGLTKKEKIENEEREKNGKIKINPLGCGRNLDWKEMEDCSDEVIKKLKEIAVDDYYSGLLKINEEIKKNE